ncbi:MAG: response regulator [Polyangiaceae bacterium]|nr:response regulator [Polyangiaceae bacterium]
MAEENLRVLVVDDDQHQLELVERTLRADGIDVKTCSSPIGVTNLIVSFGPKLVLVDVNIPALSGDRLIGISRRWVPPGTLFVLYSANDESRLRHLAREVEADGWISKSVTGVDLSKRVREIVKKPVSAR